MHNINLEDYKVVKRVKLAKTPTNRELEGSKKDFEAGMEDIGRKLADLQDTMYAHDRYGVLLCFQGMDTAGKDSLIREVFKHFNPRGVVVHSFKVPTSSELERDYLWRHYIALPERGKFAVFNRSHYENVLVTRVHPHILLNERMPGIEKVEDLTPEFWEHRFESIVDFEKHIARNGVIVMKFFLHLGKEEQRKRLLRRLEKEKHNWKFSPGDLRERARWDDYQQYYEEAINRTSKPHAPWFIIPADDKEAARFIVASLIYDEMQKYADIKEPELDEAIKRDIEMYREQLAKEK